VSGTINLENSPLLLSGNPVIIPGASFTLIHTTTVNGVIGQFDSLPQGSIFATIYTISYKGNGVFDVILTRNTSGPGSGRGHG